MSREDAQFEDRRGNYARRREDTSCWEDTYTHNGDRNMLDRKDIYSCEHRQTVGEERPVDVQGEEASQQEETQRVDACHCPAKRRDVQGRMHEPTVLVMQEVEDFKARNIGRGEETSWPEKLDWEERDRWERVKRREWRFIDRRQSGNHLRGHTLTEPETLHGGCAPRQELTDRAKAMTREDAGSELARAGDLYNRHRPRGHSHLTRFPDGPRPLGSTL
eukprot:5849327-Pleurochrysis_carterae.AAC.1